ncbi:hypothetical protein SAY87_017515 [Trapa incisa]|uniref:Transcription termination factor MTERF8, chloroplastic n=1 Tax=Trapa incisa TaxID=236973 RepID=A0AAN7KVY2_9MYRT|nr:hypothetical protein SAY87_017515 [Trapa incisa]
MPTNYGFASPAPVLPSSSSPIPNSSFLSPLHWPSSATFLHTCCHFVYLLKSSPLSRPRPVTFSVLPSSSLSKTSSAQRRRPISPPDVRAKSFADTASAGSLAFFHELGFSDRESALLFEQNPKLKVAPLDLLRARVASLRSVGIDGLDLSYLIAKSPLILTADEVDSLLCFIRDELDGKIHSVQLKRLLLSIDTFFLESFEQKVNLLFQYGIPKEKVVYILNNVNITKAVCLKPSREIKRLIDFLGDYGGVNLIMKRPVFLNYDLDEQLVSRVEFLLQLSGGDRDMTGSVFRKLPAILRYSVEHMEGHVEFLRSFAGLSDSEIFRIILVYPNMISASKDRKLQPRIEFLKQCGLGPSEIFKFLIISPLYLGLSYEGNLIHKLGLLVKIGYRFRTKELTVAMGAVTRTSCQNLQKVVGLFLDYGFSCSDIHAMSKKHPQVLQYNPISLEEKVEYLTEEMGRGLEELLSFPAFLGYRLDSRIKHRYQAKKEIRGEKMSLNKLLSVSAERFSEATQRTDGCSTCLD